jgi:hypothetical protein
VAAMAFVPIALRKYVDLYLKRNPGSSRSEVTLRLKRALAAFKAGKRCHCGAPIWVIGSAEAGDACFTCITGESTPEDDYELAEAYDQRGPDMRIHRCLKSLTGNTPSDTKPP